MLYANRRVEFELWLIDRDGRPLEISMITRSNIGVVRIAQNLLNKVYVDPRGKRWCMTEHGEDLIACVPWE